MTGFAGGGAVRYLGIVVGIDDRVTRPMAKIQARAGAMGAAMGNASRGVGLLQGQLALLGFSAAAVFGGIARQFAMFQRQTTLASFAATGFTESMAQMTNSSMALSRSLHQSPAEMGRLRKEVAQLGTPSRDAADALTEAAVRLSMVTNGELTSDEASKAIFRLLSVTSSTTDELDSALKSSMRFASMIKVAGDASAAGAGSMTQMLRRLSQAGQLANFSAAEFIALSAAMSDVDETSRDAFSTSLLRLFGKEFTDPQKAKRVADFLGMTAEAFQDMRIEAPMALLLMFVETLKGAKDQIGILSEMGFGNIRDARTIAAISTSFEKLRGNKEMAGIMEMIRGEAEADNLLIMKQSEKLLSQLQGRWDDFTASISRAAVTIGSVLEPALSGLLLTLSTLASVLGNPMIAGGLGAGGALFAGAGMMRLGAGIRRAHPMKGFKGLMFGTGAGAFGGRDVPLRAGDIRAMVPRERYKGAAQSNVRNTMFTAMDAIYASSGIFSLTGVHKGEQGSKLGRKTAMRRLRNSDALGIDPQAKARTLDLIRAGMADAEFRALVGEGRGRTSMLNDQNFLGNLRQAGINPAKMDEESFARLAMAAGGGMSRSEMMNPRGVGPMMDYLLMASMMGIDGAKAMGRGALALPNKLGLGKTRIGGGLNNMLAKAGSSRSDRAVKMTMAMQKGGFLNTLAPNRMAGMASATASRIGTGGKRHWIKKGATGFMKPFRGAAGFMFPKTAAKGAFTAGAGKMGLSLGLRGVGMAVPGLNILMTLSLIAPLLEKLGNVFDSGLLRPLGIFLKALSVVGNTINFLVNGMIDLIKKAWAAINENPIISAMVKATSNFWDKIEGGLDSANETLTGESRGTAGVPKLQNVYNIYTPNDDYARESAKDMATRSTYANFSSRALG